MSIIRWKFKSLKNEPYNNIGFSGIDISVADLCDLIMKEKGMKPGESKLQIFDASTGEEYKDYSDMIPRNKSVYVVKVPVKAVAGPLESKTAEALSTKEQGLTAEDLIGTKDVGVVTGAAVSEMDKLRAMINDETDKNERARSMAKPKWQHTKRKFTQKPPPDYVCHSCGGKDHFRQQCPKGKVPTSRALGIPATLLLQVSRPAPGVFKNSEGELVVPKVDLNAMLKSAGEKAGESKVDEVEIPSELLCELCKGVIRDAVIITCCSEAFCDECIRSHLLENDFTCPNCASNMSPDQLVINKALRKHAQKFRSELPSGAKLILPKKESPEEDSKGLPEGAADEDSHSSTPSRSEGGTKTKGEPSGKDSPSVDDGKVSLPRSPQNVPGLAVKDEGGSKGSSPLRISHQDINRPTVVHTMPNVVLSHPLVQTTPQIFPSAPQPFRPQPSFPLGSGLIPPATGFTTGLVPPAVAPIVPGSQFSNPVISVPQPSLPKPIPASATPPGGNVPLSKEAFLMLQKSLRAEQLKRKKDLSKSRSSKRRKRSDSLSSEDSLSPSPSRGSSRTHSPRVRARSRSPVGRSKKDSRRRKHEPKRSKTSRSSGKSSSSKQKRSKKRSSSPSAQSSSSKRPKVKRSKTSARNLSPIPEPETELVSNTSDSSPSVSHSPSLSPTPSSSRSHSGEGAVDQEHKAEQGREGSEGEIQDHEDRDMEDDNVEAENNRKPEEDDSPSLNVETEIADEFAEEVLNDSAEEGGLEEGEVTDDEGTSQKGEVDSVICSEQPPSVHEANEIASDSVDSDASSTVRISDISEDTSLSETDSERHRRSKKREKSSSARKDRGKRSRRREESRERRKRKERQEKRSSRQKEREKERESSRRRRDVKKKRKSHHTSEERSSRHKHRSKHSKKSKHRKY